MQGPSGSAEGALRNLQVFRTGSQQQEASASSAAVGALLDRAQATVESRVPATPSLPAIAAEAFVPPTAAEAPSLNETPTVDADSGAPQPEVTVQERCDKAEVLADAAMPTHVGEAMERLAESYYKKPLAHLDSISQPDEICKRPAAARGRPRKRPAAAVVPAALDEELPMKRPAGRLDSSQGKCAKRGRKPGVASASAARKKPAAACPADVSKNKKCITRKEQLKQKPSGCSRCRSTPGCCPSCWVQRGFRVV